MGSSSSEEDSEEPAAKRKKIEQEAELPNIPLKLSSDLVTLSSVPRDRIKTIVNLEQIKARNKPKEAPKAPKAAPFFLPSTSEVHPTLFLCKMKKIRHKRRGHASSILER